MIDSYYPQIDSLICEVSSASGLFPFLPLLIFEYELLNQDGWKTR